MTKQFQNTSFMEPQSDATVQMLKQQQETAYLDVPAKFRAGMTAMRVSPSITNYLFDVADNILADTPSQKNMLTAVEADELYPIGKKRTESVSEYNAYKANSHYKEYTEFNSMLERSNNSALGSVSGFIGNLAGGFVHDPIMMAGAALSGVVLGASAKGASMTAGLYNTYSFLGANWARAMAARATVEAVGSLAFDVPALLATQQLINRSDFSGYEMTGTDVAMEMAMGATFSGMVGNISGFAGRKNISGFAGRNNIAASSALLQKVQHIREAAQAKGIHLGLDERLISQEI